MLQKTKTKEKWTLLEQFPEDYLDGSSYSDTEKQLLYTRGIKSPKDAENYLNPKYEDIPDPLLLKDVDRAVSRIEKAVEGNEKVTVYGDYDVDGITATALMREILESLGLVVDCYIPRRADEGYGLNKEAIDTIRDNGTSLIITVDLGITAVEEVDYVKQIGLDIIVTDHHAIPESGGKQILPKTIVINPKRNDSKYPSRDLAGVGVAFKLAQALFAKFPNYLSVGQEKWLLDIVALGTICDVVSLSGENRLLAFFGLKVLSKTRRVGLKMLAEVSAVLLEEVTSYQVGFQLGPRLNASGRIGTADTSLRLIETKDDNEARLLALKLNKLNEERQKLTEEIIQEAYEELETRDDKAKIFLLAKKNWPSGVLGIVASKLTDRLSRPTIVFEDNGETCVGSARSPKFFNIVEALESCAEILIRYGGHARAAGLTVKKEHFVLLGERLLSVANDKIADSDMIPEYFIEKEIESDELSGAIYKFIRKLEPFGMGNPVPNFLIKNIEINNYRKVGSRGSHLKINATKDNRAISVIYFNGAEKEINKTIAYDMIFNISENKWNGIVSYEARCISMREGE